MLIKDVSLLHSGQLVSGRDILIEEGRIAQIGPDLKDESGDEAIDGHGKLAIPGLINCHTHLATASLRCFTDDLGNTEALQALLQKEAKMDSRSAKAAA